MLTKHLICAFFFFSLAGFPSLHFMRILFGVSPWKWLIEGKKTKKSTEIAKKSSRSLEVAFGFLKKKKVNAQIGISFKSRDEFLC